MAACQLSLRSLLTKLFVMILRNIVRQTKVLVSTHIWALELPIAYSLFAGDIICKLGIFIVQEYS